MSKQNLKFFNKVKRFNREQRENFINTLKSHTCKFSERVFNEILNSDKPDQLRALRDIVLSVPIKDIEKTFEDYENHYTIVKRNIEKQISIHLEVNDIEEVKEIINNAGNLIIDYKPKDILRNGLRSFLIFHDLQFPEYIFNDLLNSLFPIENFKGINKEKDDDKKYFDELLGLDILEHYIIDIFNDIEINLRIPLIVNFLLWDLFELELIKQFNKTNQHYFFPEEEIGNFELKIYVTLVNILKQKFSETFSDLNIVTLIKIIENLYTLIKNSNIFIEPWKEYLME